MKIGIANNFYNVRMIICSIRYMLGANYRVWLLSEEISLKDFKKDKIKNIFKSLISEEVQVAEQREAKIEELDGILAVFRHFGAKISIVFKDSEIAPEILVYKLEWPKK